MAINVDLAGAGDLVKAVGGLAGQIRSAITGDLSPEAKASLEAAAVQAENAVDLAQSAINSEEAKSSNFFIAGARPSIMWVCALAFALNFLVEPIATWVLNIVGSTVVLPKLDLTTMLPVLLGMLGLGGYRTIEKIQGVQNTH